MNQEQSPGLPVWAIILDVFGTLLVGGGIFLLVYDGELMGMQTEALKGPAIAAIVVGGMLTVPLIAAVVRRGMSSR